MQKNSVLPVVLVAFLAYPIGQFVLRSLDPVGDVRQASEPAEQKQVAFMRTVGSDSLIRVTEEFKKCDPEDKILIYKLFAGSAEYLKNCESLSSTFQFRPGLGRVQSSYGWNLEKYPSFTDAVSDYLVEVDYVTPKELKTKQERLAFAEIFQGLAEATKNE